jgi:uroporphyrinogen-III decarboxylase
MTPKERMTAAMKGEPPDVAPAAPAYIGLFRAEAEKRHYADQYRDRMKGMTRYSPDHDEDIEFRANALYKAYDMFGEMPDCIEVTPGPARAWAERVDIVSENSRLFYLDTVTGDLYDFMENSLPSGRDYLYGNIPSSQQDVWDRSVIIQSKDVIDTIIRLVPLDELEEEGVFDLPKKIVREKGDEYFIIVYDSTPYTAAYLLGFQGLMLTFYDNPDNLKYYIERIFEQRKPVLRGFADAGYDGIYAEEIFSGVDIISPELFDEFVFPFNAEYFKLTRSLGLLTAYYMCGNPVPLLSRMCELECDAVACEESKKNFEIEITEVVKQIGHAKCVFGNVDAPLYGVHARQEQIKIEVNRQVEAGKNAKGFVVSTGSPYPLDSPLQNIDALVAAAHSFRLD